MIEKVRARIEELKAQRAKALEKIEESISAIDVKAEKAAATMEKAVRDMKPEVYAAAKKEKAELLAGREMYELRRAQVFGDATTDEESEKVIRELRDYNKTLGDKFLQDVAKIYEELRKLTDAYLNDVREAQAVADEWTADIHPNYISDTMTYSQATGSAKSPRPLRVELRPVGEAATISSMLLAKDNRDAWGGR